MLTSLYWSITISSICPHFIFDVPPSGPAKRNWDTLSFPRMVEDIILKPWIPYSLFHRSKFWWKRGLFKNKCGPLQCILTLLPNFFDIFSLFWYLLTILIFSHYFDIFSLFWYLLTILISPHYFDIFSLFDWLTFSTTLTLKSIFYTPQLVVSSIITRKDSTQGF